MSLAELAGYFGAVTMGISLGLIGGGGSILTVPILVYLFRIDSTVATFYSLFIVGLSSLVGVGSHVTKVDWKTAVYFGLPSVISVSITRLYIVPAIPNEIITTGSFVLTKSIALLILFAIIMLIASERMIRGQVPVASDSDKTPSFLNFFGKGGLVGLITGLVGAGGGFLIVPALALLAKLPMKQAIATSLVVITTNSFVGFAVSAGKGTFIDWQLLLTFSGIAAIGIFIGAALSKKISNEVLKPAFGWFVLMMGTYILVKELFFHSL
ncbi:MAG: sulfite exporter TauE/SafE family protein [Bacteroidia bacterium]|nr:sulfite exporter TauE/SafE family protein [Bacteroidia bacterium]